MTTNRDFEAWVRSQLQEVAEGVTARPDPYGRLMRRRRNGWLRISFLAGVAAAVVSGGVVAVAPAGSPEPRPTETYSFRGELGWKAELIDGAPRGNVATDEAFTTDLAASYAEQDAALLERGEPIRNELEMILRPDGRRGWYVTSKTLLTDGDTTLGIVAVSYDLRTAADVDRGHAGVQAAVDLVRRRYAEPLRVADLAAAAGLSTSRLERSMRTAIAMSPKQLLVRTRLDEAIRRLEAAIETLRANGSENELGLALGALARAKRLVGNDLGATASAKEALAILDRLGTLEEPDRLRDEFAAARV